MPCLWLKETAHILTLRQFVFLVNELFPTMGYVTYNANVSVRFA